MEAAIPSSTMAAKPSVDRHGSASWYVSPVVVLIHAMFATHRLIHFVSTKTNERADPIEFQPRPIDFQRRNLTSEK